MTLEEAKANVGNAFKVKAFPSDCLLGRFDTIKKVGNSGTIYGEFTAAHHEDCRLKQDKPEHLKSNNDEVRIHNLPAGA